MKTQKRKVLEKQVLLHYHGYFFYRDRVHDIGKYYEGGYVAQNIAEENELSIDNCYYSLC